MTTIHESTTETGGEAAVIPPLVQSFLTAIRAGRGADLGPLYARDAVSDLTVPNWRYHARGREQIAANYAQWFAFPAEFEELEVVPTPSGAAVTYLMVWEEPTGPFAAHHTHMLEVADGRIRRDTVFCGGRWSASLQAEMEEAEAAS